MDRVLAYLPSGPRKSGFSVMKVNSIRPRFMCGNPLLLTILTCGLLPTSMPMPADVTVTGTVGGRTERREYFVALQGWFSAWHSLIPEASDDRALARGLLDAIDNDRRSTPIRQRLPNRLSP